MGNYDWKLLGTLVVCVFLHAAVLWGVFRELDRIFPRKK
jgi:hypothetical protein